MTEAVIIYLLRKSMDWFLYDIGLRNERLILTEDGTTINNEDKKQS